VPFALEVRTSDRILQDDFETMVSQHMPTQNNVFFLICIALVSFGCKFVCRPNRDTVGRPIKDGGKKEMATVDEYTGQEKCPSSGLASS